MGGYPDEAGVELLARAFAGKFTGDQYPEAQAGRAPRMVRRLGRHHRMGPPRRCPEASAACWLWPHPSAAAGSSTSPTALPASTAALCSWCWRRSHTRAVPMNTAIPSPAAGWTACTDGRRTITAPPVQPATTQQADRTNFEATLGGTTCCEQRGGYPTPSAPPSADCWSTTSFARFTTR